MASTRDIKKRRDSIHSTEQITRAMKLVSTVKLQKAREKAENARPYTSVLYDTVLKILGRTEATDHPYLVSHEKGKTCVLLLTGNRGLCGGYNQNVIKKVTERFPDPQNLTVYYLGKKGLDTLSGKGYEAAEDLSEVINAPLYKDAIALTDKLLKAYQQGLIKEIYIAYTEFKNTVSHEAKCVRLLPIDRDMVPEGSDGIDLPMNFEPNDEAVLTRLIPQYLASFIYGALLMAIASENGARMSAMDAATDNCEEMISDLQLLYNRARQGNITQELTEIIAGRNAVN